METSATAVTCMVSNISLLQVASERQQQPFCQKTGGGCKTKSSAIAEGLCDPSCQLKSCQMPRNSTETTCTISPEQIEVTKLEGWLRWADV